MASHNDVTESHNDVAVDKPSGDVIGKKSVGEIVTGESPSEPKSVGVGDDDDRDSIRNDDVSENSATLVTDSITDEPTLTNS